MNLKYVNLVAFKTTLSRFTLFDKGKIQCLWGGALRDEPKNGCEGN